MKHASFGASGLAWFKQLEYHDRTVHETPTGSALLLFPRVCISTAINWFALSALPSFDKILPYTLNIQSPIPKLIDPFEI